jgi:uncharacterized membrane protein
MTVLLTNLRNAVITGFVLAALLVLLYVSYTDFDGRVFWPFLVRWLHVASAIMWIGLLWYFNFVQTPTMPKIPDELKPGVSRYIAPEALFWFRWSAMFTLFFGLILAAMNGYLLDAYTLGATLGFADLRVILIGIGMWLATIMWFNVWFVIWPNQQKALNINNAHPNLPADQKARSARTAGLASRINTVLSIPMSFCMVAATHIFTG